MSVLQAQVAKYRSKGRLPALSYLYQGKTAICRCAQPMAGVQSKRSQYDELLLQKIWEANPSGKTVKIVDTRPKINAIATKVRVCRVSNAHFRVQRLTTGSPRNGTTGI